MQPWHLVCNCSTLPFPEFILLSLSTTQAPFDSALDSILMAREPTLPASEDEGASLKAKTNLGPKVTMNAQTGMEIVLLVSFSRFILRSSVARVLRGLRPHQWAVTTDGQSSQDYTSSND